MLGEYGEEEGGDCEGQEEKGQDSGCKWDCLEEWEEGDGGHDDEVLGDRLSKRRIDRKPGLMLISLKICESGWLKWFGDIDGFIRFWHFTLMLMSRIPSTTILSLRF